MDPLNETEIRALACLIEKESTTPEYYPLSLNALTLACNQKTNRDPVVSYDEDTVREALNSLRDKRLARPASAGSRVAKYEHSIVEVFNLGRRELALLCTLMLRGPQTLGELKTRSARIHEFADIAALAAALERLERRTDGPYVTRLARRPGQKEARYAHLLTGAPPIEPEILVSDVVTVTSDDAARLTELELEVQSLRRDLTALSARLEELLLARR